MNRLSLRNNRLKVETSGGELPIILEESVEEYTSSNEWKHNWKMMSTCNQLDSESLGPWPTIYAQKLPGHWLPPFEVSIQPLEVLELDLGLSHIYRILRLYIVNLDL